MQAEAEPAEADAVAAGVFGRLGGVVKCLRHGIAWFNASADASAAHQLRGRA